jgi:glycosyltransferase involved in cell wall biosynthesis
VLQAKRAYPWPHLEVSDAALARSVARERACYEAARACCVESHWAAQSVVEDYGQPAERVKVVGVGNVLTPRPLTDRNWSTPRFLFVGGAWKRKNGDRTVAAFRAVREHHPQAELHLVGTHPRVDLPGVIGHGWLEIENPTERARLERLYEQATCLVLPSLHEPAGTAHVEAAATGVASIGSTNGGAATLIGDAGLLVNPESDREIVAAMLKLADPEVAASLGARALERSRLFTWRTVAERVLRALAPPGIDVAPLAEFL